MLLIILLQNLINNKTVSQISEKILHVIYNQERITMKLEINAHYKDIINKWVDITLISLETKT